MWNSVKCHETGVYVHRNQVNGLNVYIEETAPRRSVKISVDGKDGWIFMTDSRSATEKIRVTKSFADAVVEHLCKVHPVFVYPPYSHEAEIDDSGRCIWKVNDEYTAVILPYVYGTGHQVKITYGPPDEADTYVDAYNFIVTERYHLEQEILDMIEFLNKTRK
jgi:hypothetical protein